MKNSMEVPQKVKNRTTYNPAIPHLGIHPKEMKSLFWRHSCTPLLTVMLFTKARTWKQPKSLLMDKRIQKMWYIHTHTHTHTHTHIHTMEYCLSTEKKEILPLLTTWKDLRSIMLNEIRKTQILYKSHLYVKSKEGQNRNKVEWWLPGAGKWGYWGQVSQRV